jgi:hypothetical protein
MSKNIIVVTFSVSLVQVSTGLTTNISQIFRGFLPFAVGSRPWLRHSRPCLLTIRDRFPALFSNTLTQVYKRLRTQLANVPKVPQAMGVQDRRSATQRSCKMKNIRMYCVFLTIDFSYSERKWRQCEAASGHGGFPRLSFHCQALNMNW